MADEKTISPISAAEPPKADPLATPAATHASTLKLKPVVRTGVAAPAAGLKPGLKLPTKPTISTAGLKLPPRPVIRKPGSAPATPSLKLPVPPAPNAAAKPLDALKSVTANLKSVTAPIPQQAILHKTGIVAEPNLTEAQREALKSKTSRISLSDAMGVAPVKNDAAPMKTIRIKRPVDLPPGATTATLKPVAKPEVAAPAPESPAAQPAAAAAPQPRKVLKINRPGAAQPAAAQPAGEAAQGDVADIPDLPPVAPVAASAKGVADVSSGVAVTSLIAAIIGCIAMGLLSYMLYFDCFEVVPY